MKKKVDSRIRTLIENGVKLGQRSLFVIVGDRGREQIVNLHYMLSKSRVKTRPSVLWCYKKELGFSSHKRKKMKHVQSMSARGLLDPDKDDPFELFVSSTNIRYCYYKETHNILGNTYGMLVLQDFEALTPNLLARTVETVEGGGIIVILLKTMTSLRQLYTMTMDVHARFRTSAHHDVVPRFNERFILSLIDCRNCLVVDDELNVLPLAAHQRVIEPVTAEEQSNAELAALQASVRETEIVGPLVALSRTLDQARALLTFAAAVSEKSLRSTVALTAARGRGKSAAMGLAIASAVGFGYSNIFVTSPSPENLKTLFEFVLKGLEAIGMKEHMDYSIVQGSGEELSQVIVRINIFRSHRQTIQYIDPREHALLSQAELVVIDEAAAIPLPLVRAMMGNYLVFMASTVHGYEGTGRSLSLKLIQQLRSQTRAAAVQGAGGAPGEGGPGVALPAAGPTALGVATAGAPTGLPSAVAAGASAAQATGGRVLREIELSEPIRYSSGDPVEAWLNALLCLDAQVAPVTQCPHPAQCELYYVDRDALFSYHAAAEQFLRRLMALFVSSHYKNSPNDLQLLSDAPAHHLFVLLGPVDERTTSLPDVLCAVQVCLEGEISKDVVAAGIARGERGSGDLIPWTITQQFQDPTFASLSGARIVRIAVHPSLHRMGYGTRALELLEAYYSLKIVSLDEQEPAVVPAKSAAARTSGAATAAAAAAAAAAASGSGGSTLATEQLAPRPDVPSLLQKLSQRRAERLHYLGTSFGITEALFGFWQRSGYVPLYVRQTTNDLTGEHTAVVLKTLPTHGPQPWLGSFHADFLRRLVTLLGSAFRGFSTGLALALLQPVPADETPAPLTKQEMDGIFTPFDLKRLDSYGRNLIDYHTIADLVPWAARLLFLRRIAVHLSPAQAAIVLGVGLQLRTIDDVARELQLPAPQVMALFNKAMLKLYGHFRALAEAAVAQELPAAQPAAAPLGDVRAMEADLDEGAREAMASLRKQREALLADPELSKFAISAEGAAAAAAAAAGGVPSIISVRSKHGRPESDRPEKATKKVKTKGKHHRG